MIDLYDLKLSDILPPSIKDNAVIKALATALDSELQAISKLIIETEIMTRIDELPEELIDLLAWQFHVDFYEPLGLDLDKKRTLVKNSISWHRKKGTKQLMEEILKVLFVEEYKAKEWFEYSGRPYFFTLESWDNIESEDKYNRLLNVIKSVKNVRSWLDYLLFYKQNRLDIYYSLINREKHSNITVPESHIDDTYSRYHVGQLTRERQNNYILPESLINDTKNSYFLASITRSRQKLITQQSSGMQNQESKTYLGTLTKHICKFTTKYDSSINSKAHVTRVMFAINTYHIKTGCATV